MTTRTTETSVQLPLEKNIAIYAQPPSSSQDEEATTYTQVYDLVQFALSCGYSPEQITIFADTEPTDIDLEKHERYQALITAIRSGSVAVVFLSDRDCFFAGVDVEHVNSFMKLCMLKGLLIATPQMIYDFQNLSHVALFRRHFVTLQKG